ncbi:MAG: ParB/RepB/Spo0J family partition protein [Calditrichaeota bacterium]|nr:MAG: ParB/RepB/Spo0J family partition protein [Calditrichota bacterium]
MELSLIENIQREDLNPIDEANGYQTLITKCHLTQEEVAKKVGKERSTIANALRILKLPEIIQQSLVEGEITAGHARSLLALPTESEQIAVWKKIVRDRISVRQVERLVKGKKSPVKKAKKTVRATDNPFLREAEDKIRGILGTQVRVIANSKGSGGKIEIEYYSSTDIERILDLLERI